VNSISSFDETEQPIHVKVEALGYLRTIIGKKEFLVELRGRNTITELIATLSRTYGREVSDAILSPTSREFLVLILINGKDIDFLQKTKTLLSDGDNVTMIPMSAGG
jgi:MoaD family protein